VGKCRLLAQQLKDNGLDAYSFNKAWKEFAANEDVHYPGNTLQRRVHDKTFHLKMTKLGHALKGIALKLGLDIIEYNE